MLLTEDDEHTVEEAKSAEEALLKFQVTTILPSW
jgi:hypothetical protein